MSQLLQPMPQAVPISAESLFLRRYFEALEQHGCYHAVMRNHQQLPDSLGGSDLDMLVVPGALLQAHDLAQQVAAANGAVVLGSVRGRGFCQLHILGRDDGGWGCRIDLFPSANCDGHEYAVIDWQRDVYRHRGIAVLRPELGELLAVVKSMLTHGTVPARYAASITDLPRLQPLDFERWLQPIGARARALVAAALAAAANGDASALRPLRAAVRSHQLWPRPLPYLRRGIAWQCTKLRRYLRPSGAVIAFVGVDGVGKSTLIDAVLPVLDAATHGACTVFHLRPGLLPAPARLLRRKAPAAGANLDPHAARPSGTFVSLLRIGWLLADYVLGHCMLVRPRIARLPGIVLFDRYAYDLGIDPRRCRIGLSPRVAGWLARLAPRPDLTICLVAEPQTILARKRELPEAEVRRQLAALRAFAANTEKTALLCTDGAPEQVRGELLELMCALFARRQQQREN